MTTQNSAMGDEELQGELNDILDDLVAILPIKATEIGWEKVGEDVQDTSTKIVKLLASRDQQIALAARIDELEREDEAERELFRNGKNPDTSGYRDDRLEELKQAQNKEK